MCQVLCVSISAYYRWLASITNNRQQQDMILAALVKAAHIRSRETYGNERLHAELTASGVGISKYKVRKLRSLLGLRCKQVKRFKCTNNSHHDKPIAPNLLNQQFTVERPN
jgi:putative transposase